MTAEIARWDALPPAALRCEWRSNGLVLPSDLTLDEGIALVEAVRRMHGGVSWWWGDLLNGLESRWGEMYSQALDESDLDMGSLRNAKWVAGRIALSCRHDNLGFGHHLEVAPLDAGDRDRLLTQAAAEGWSTRQLRSAVRDVRRSINPPPPLPIGTFDLIYADPPWRYEFVEAENRSIENQYPTMDLDEIKALELPTLAPDALLLLWATPPKLEEAIEVMREWGFSYRSCLVWVKHAIGMGYWARQRHELLLVGKVGDFPAPEPADRPDSVIESPRQEHSRKPDHVYDLIERMFPDARKIELFSRTPRDGWAAWGNQVTHVA